GLRRYRGRGKSRGPHAGHCPARYIHAENGRAAGATSDPGSLAPFAGGGLDVARVSGNGTARIPGGRNGLHHEISVDRTHPDSRGPPARPEHLLTISLFELVQPSAVGKM